MNSKFFFRLIALAAGLVILGIWASAAPTIAQIDFPTHGAVVSETLNNSIVRFSVQDSDVNDGLKVNVFVRQYVSRNWVTRPVFRTIASNLDLNNRGVCSDNNFSDLTSCSIDFNSSRLNNGFAYIDLNVFNALGEVTSVSTPSFIIDNQIPLVYMVWLNAGNAVSTDSNVLVSISTQDANQMQLSCDKNHFTAWIPFASLVSFDVTVGPGCSNLDGNKTVFVRVKDAAQNVSNIGFDSIELNRFQPIAQIHFPNSGDLVSEAQHNSIARFSVTDLDSRDKLKATLSYHTGSNSVPIPLLQNIDLNAPGVCSDQNFLDDTNCAIDWNSTGLNGNAFQLDLNVFNQFGDIELISTAGFSIDNNAPTLQSLELNDSVEETISIDLNVFLQAIDANQMQFSCNGTQYSTPTPFFGDFQISLNKIPGCSVLDGQKTVYARVIDRAGNLSNALNAAIVLDRSGPIIESFNPLNGSVSRNRRPTISTTISDDLGELDENSILFTLNGKQYSLNSSEIDFNSDSGELVFTPRNDFSKSQTVTVTVSAKDLLGNASSAHWSFSIDAVGPNAIQSLQAQQVSVDELDLHWPSVGGAARYRVYRSVALMDETSKVLLDETTANSFDDVGVTPGNWVYAVTALDSLGNESALSNQLSFQIALRPSFSISPQELFLNNGRELPLSVSLTNDSGETQTVSCSFESSDDDLIIGTKKKIVSLNPHESTAFSVGVHGTQNLGDGDFTVTALVDFNGFLESQDISVHNGTNDSSVSFEAARQAVCKEKRKSSIDVDVSNNSGNSVDLNLSAFSAFFSASFEDRTLHLGPNQTKTVQLDVFPDSQFDYSSVPIPTNISEPNPVETSSCSNLYIRTNSIRIDAGNSQRVQYTVFNNNPTAFNGSLNAFDNERDIQVDELNSNASIPANGSQRFTVEVQVSSGSLQQIAQGTIRLAGSFSNGVSCSGSDVEKDFTVFVNQNVQPQCSDVQLTTRKVSLQESSSSLETFSIQNDSIENFKVESFRIESDETFYDVDEVDHTENIPAQGTGTFKSRFTAFPVNSTKTGTGFWELGGSFSGGLHCSAQDIESAEFDVTVRNRQESQQFATPFKIQLLAKSDSVTVSTDLPIQVVSCAPQDTSAPIQRLQYYAREPTIELLPGQTKTIDLVLRSSNVSGTSSFSLQGIPIELDAELDSDQASISAGEEKIVSLTITADEDAEPQTVQFTSKATIASFSAQDTISVRILPKPISLTALQIVSYPSKLLLSTDANVFSTIVIANNSNDTISNLSLQALGLPEGVSFRSPLNSLTLVPGQVYQWEFYLNASPEAKAGKQDITFSFDSAQATASQVVSLEVKQSGFLAGWDFFRTGLASFSNNPLAGWFALIAIAFAILLAAFFRKSANVTPKRAF